MTARDNRLAALIAERFTPLPESHQDQAFEDRRLGPDRLRRAILDIEMHTAIEAIGLAS